MMMMNLMNLTHHLMMMMLMKTLRMMTMSPQIALTQMKSPLKAQTIHYNLHHKSTTANNQVWRVFHSLSTHGNVLLLICFMLIENV